MQLHEALAQITEIRTQIARTETFRGYRSATVAFSGLLALGGAGVQAASTVAAQGAQAIITGNVGPNAHKALAAGNISIYQVGNGVTARDALASLGRGELTAVAGPTVTGHWA